MNLLTSEKGDYFRHKNDTSDKGSNNRPNQDSSGGQIFHFFDGFMIAGRDEIGH